VTRGIFFGRDYCSFCGTLLLQFGYEVSPKRLMCLRLCLQLVEFALHEGGGGQVTRGMLLKGAMSLAPSCVSFSAFCL
jgi:hypothetical protein